MLLHTDILFLGISLTDKPLIYTVSIRRSKLPSLCMPPHDAFSTITRPVLLCHPARSAAFRSCPVALRLMLQQHLGLLSFQHRMRQHCLHSIPAAGTSSPPGHGSLTYTLWIPNQYLHTSPFEGEFRSWSLKIQGKKKKHKNSLRQELHVQIHTTERRFGEMRVGIWQHSVQMEHLEKSNTHSNACIQVWRQRSEFPCSSWKKHPTPLQILSDGKTIMHLFRKVTLFNHNLQKGPCPHPCPCPNPHEQKSLWRGQQRILKYQDLAVQTVTFERCLWFVNICTNS